MVKGRFLWLLFFMFIINFSFVSGDLNASLVQYLSMDDLLNASVGNDGSYTSITQVPGKINNAVDLVDDLGKVNFETAHTSADISISFWGYLDGNENTDTWFCKDGSFNYGYWQNTPNTNLFLSNNINLGLGFGLVSTGSWQHFAMVNNGSSWETYVDGVSIGTASNAADMFGSTNDLLFGKCSWEADSYNGKIDEVGIWSRPLSPAEVAELASGLVYPFTSTTSSNATTEQTSFFNQTNNVSVNTGSYATVFSGSQEILNATQGYATFVINVLPTNSNSICRVTLDGVDYGTETTRTGTTGQYGVMFLTSDVFNLSVGNHTYNLECKRGSSGTFDVSNSNGIIHVLKNKNNVEINKTSAHTSIDINDIGGVWTNKTFQYNISNTNITGDKVLNLVLEGDLVYKYVAANYILANITFGGEQCGAYRRYSSSAGLGSGGYFCGIENATGLTSANLTIRAQHASVNSSGNQVNSTFVIKEFILNPGSFNHTDFGVVQIDSNNWVDVAELSINNSEVELGDLVASAGISVQSDSGSSEIDFRIVTDDQNGSVLHRDVSGANLPGLTVSQYVFKNIPLGVKTVKLQGRCDNSACSTYGGDFVAYMTDDLLLGDLSLAFSLRNSTGDLVESFNVTTEDGLTFITNTGTVNVFSNNLFENLTVEVSGYLDFVASNVNMSNGSWVEYVDDFEFENFTFTNFVNYNDTNYTRNLGIGFNTIGCPANYTLQKIINGVYGGVSSFSCNTNITYNTSYTHTSNSLFNIGFRVNFSSGNEAESVITRNWSFKSDITNPGAVLNRTTAGSGFSTDFSFDASLKCTDAISPLLVYNVTYNGENVVYANTTSNQTLSNTSDLVSGNFTLLASCQDFFGQTNASIVGGNVYAKTFALIDERNGSDFDVNNPNSVRLYFDDNRSFFDFKENGTTKINFTSFTADKLRLELTYNTTGGGSDTVITRYIDVSLVDDVARLCANVHGVDHFEQLIIASQQRAVIMKNVFADCYIAADYTRFAYQDALVLKAFTISSMYYLYTFIDGSQEFLSAVDGTISSFINLDTLEFAQQAYELNILRDTLTVEKLTNVSARIRYINLENDKVSANMLIRNLNTGGLLFNTSSFTNPNNISVTFNWNALNITNRTIFKIDLLTVDNNGDSETITRYFDTEVATGYISGVIALVISILLVFTGFTISTARLAFSWFGIVMVVLAMGVLTLGIGGWWYLPVIVIETIILLYTIMMLVFTNQRSIS